MSESSILYNKSTDIPFKEFNMKGLLSSYKIEAKKIENKSEEIRK